MGRAMNGAKALAKRLPPSVVAMIRHVADPAFAEVNARYSFSQEGEDLYVARLFDGQDRGFYVDVGAHHPTRFSNTQLLYLKGWRGINVDPTPGAMVEFARKRPRDINLELAISSIPGRRMLHVYDESALNTLSIERRADLDRSSPYSAAGQVEVVTATLESVLSTHLPPSTRIDLMTIDAEGQDFDILQSNDWNRFRPGVLLIEVLDTHLDQLEERPEIRFLKARGYRLMAKPVNTVALLDVRP